MAATPRSGALKLVLAALCLLLATACGAAGAQAPPVNAQDVMFVQMMVQHHRQGIEIAKLGSQRATNDQLRILVAAVASTQQDEVEMMLRWLYAWEQPLTAASGAHDHHGGMPETDRKQIRALKKSKSFEHDLMTLLIAHQGDAIKMADAEVASGADPAVKEWAGQVQASRKAQIDLMKDLLKR
ncbi:DUF305 domain-containing protein [Nonomuraea sp. NPDC050227]|uniref:DUF305 domain-containing protein n=1 Tax=Nonomuraea sp. NPDC050227 TaxID=3364360 RepID=UPI0037B1FED2